MANSDMSTECGGGRHDACPGYYLGSHPCRCSCHKTPAADEPRTTDPLTALWQSSRIPPAQLVGKLPKGGKELDYLGHAAVTDILLETDPRWSWEPFAVDQNGLPKVSYDAAGQPRGLWIRLTVHGHTRIGIGTCSSSANDPYKELIGDALRNAAMRFGVALSLWAKEEWADEGVEAGDAKSQPGDRTRSGEARGSAPPENDPRAGNGAVLPQDQAIARKAAELGLSDDERADVIERATNGRTRSGKDVKPSEVALIFKALEATAAAKR